MHPGWDSMFIKTITDQSKSLKVQSYKPGQRLPVFPAAALLADKQHQFFLEQVSRFSKLGTQHFKQLYKLFINHFVEFVQVLPVQNDAPLCSLMNESLVRGVNVLHQFLQNHPDASPLARYAIFTASVLQEVASVVVNQKIFITNEDGMTIEQWNPFEASLLLNERAEYYKIIPLSSAYKRMAHSMTPILARQLLPKEGFSWITSETAIFIDWLDALQSEGREGVGRLTRTIQLYKQNAKSIGVIESLPVIQVPFNASPATTYGDQFFDWLKQSIANGQVKVNTPDAGVHVTSQGVFIERGAVFKQYVDLHVDVPVNMFSVYQQFGNLFGLTKLSGIDYRIEQLFSEYPEATHKYPRVGFSSPLSSAAKQIREGVMIADPQLVFTKGEIPSVTPHMKALPNAKPPKNIPTLQALAQKKNLQPKA